MPAIARNLSTLALERLDDGLVVLSFSVPDHRQNVLTAAALADLASVLDDLARAAGPARPRALVIRSGRPGTFFAGADLARLEGLGRLPAGEIERLCAAGKRLFGRLTESPWPSVALIEGACLGGGLELALACDLRVAATTPETLLGCPEVKLGLLPGWGGTVRLSRLIGPGPAVELCAGGEPVSGPAALRLGLVDACVPEEALLDSARTLVEVHERTGCLADRRRRQAAPVALAAEERDFLAATSMAVILGRTGGHYPAPPAILETILSGSGVDAADAERLESAAFARLALTPVAGQLLRVFRLGERNRRDPGVGAEQAGDDTAAAGPSTPAVVGAGIMGAGIAASHLRAGFPVTLVDVDGDVLARSVPDILDEAAWDRATKRPDAARARALAGRIRTATRLAAVADADLVIESVTERTDIKQQVLAELERTVAPEAVIATNTSTNPIARLAESLARPARFCGIHFFNPVRRMTLVEIVRGPATDDATVATAVAHVKRLGKCPVVVRDSPGFLVNRLLNPYLQEAVQLVREGVAAPRIDRAARAFGMPMGPIELVDMIGLDTAFYAGLVMNAAYGDRIEASPVIPALVKSGRLGRKSGHGFYAYRDAARRQPGTPDAEAAAIVARYALPPRQTPDAALADRLLLPMLLEALRVLDEGIVRDGRDIDLAVIHALGFPAFRGGLLAWADTLGAAGVLARLEPLADLGPRMQPPAGLVALARAGGSFTT